MKKRKKLLTVTAAALLAATVWTYLSIHREDWTVVSPRIPAVFDGLRITLLTDIHGVELGPDNRRLAEAVQASRPDLIAISGDLADEYTDLSMLEPLLQQLTAIAPTYYVTGNHEWSREDTEELLAKIEACGVTVLRNDYVLLQRDNQQLVLAGAEDKNAYADMEQPNQLMDRIRQEVGGDPFVIMLSHRNDALTQWAALATDLVLAGHGHGGVIRLPLVGGLLGVNRELFPDDEEGLYTAGRTTLAVSRGVGGIRLWNRPHIPTIVLQHTAP